MKYLIKSAALVLGLLPPAMAQSNPAPSAPSENESTVQLSPFMVTAPTQSGYRADQTMLGSRTVRSLLDLDSAVAIIGQQEIADIGAYQLYQVLQYGVSGVTQNSNIGDDINIRGFRAANGFMRDGYWISNYITTQFYDIERVEILKGPGALLTGNNTNVGGSVNFVSRLPTPTPQAEIEATVSNWSYYRLQANVSGPLVKSRDLTLNYRLTAGWLEGNRPKEIEDQKERFIGAAFQFRWGPKTSLLLEGYWYEQLSYLYAEDFIDIRTRVNNFTGLTRAVLNPYDTPDFSPAQARNRFWRDHSGFWSATYLQDLTEHGHLRVNVASEIGDNFERYLRGNAVLADDYTISRTDIPIKSQYRSWRYQLDYLHEFTPISWATFNTVVGNDGAIRKSWSGLALNAMPNLDTRLHNSYPNDAAYFAQPLPGINLPFTSMSGNNATLLSYYFNENLALWNRLNLVVGLRWFAPGGVSENYLTDVLTNNDGRKYRVHKYGFVVKALPWLSIYGTDAENFFPASSSPLDLVTSSDQKGPLPQNGQGVDQEYGLKFDHDFTPVLKAWGDVAHFNTYQSHNVGLGLLPSGNIGRTDLGSTTARGWEADLGAAIKLSSCTIDFIAGYFHGNSSLANDLGKAYVEQATDFARRKYNLMAKITLTNGPLRSLMAGGGVEYQSKRRESNYEISSPATGIVFAGYKINRHWRVQLNVDNVTNAYYPIEIYLPALVGTSDPRRIRGTVGYTF